MILILPPLRGSLTGPHGSRPPPAAASRAQNRLALWRGRIKAHGCQTAESFSGTLGVRGSASDVS
jgi:hypothetical protein